MAKSKEFRNCDTLQFITNKNRHCMKSPTPETQCAESIFKCNTLFVLLTLQIKISRSIWIWHNPSKLLTSNFNNKYFHNSVDWSRIYLQVYILSWQAKVLRFTVFRLLKNAFVKLPCPYNDRINNPPYLTSPINLPKTICPPSAMKIFPAWGEALCPCSIGKSCWGVSLNICKKVQNKTW